MWSPRTLRRTGLAAAVFVALVTTEWPDPRPPTGPAVPLDAFTATADEVAEVRASGARPVCRLRAAVWEPHRPDAARFPPELLAGATGLFGDHWLDIRQWDTLAPLLSDRLRLCREKGFSTVQVSADWGHPAGRDLTAADWHRFAARLEALATGHGLVVQTRPAASA